MDECTYIDPFQCAQGKTEILRQFCLPTLSEDEWRSEHISELTQTRKVCPPYLVPSTPDEKRGICVPNYALEPLETEKSTNMSLILERIQISETRMLIPSVLLEGAEYILSKAVAETFWEKTWWEHINKVLERKSLKKRFSSDSTEDHA